MFFLAGHFKLIKMEIKNIYNSQKVTIDFYYK